jgi:TP901 family phage tail tape measure protein
VASQEEIAKLLISLEGEVHDLKKKLAQGERSAESFGKTVRKTGQEIRNSWIAATAVIGGITIALKKSHGEFATFQHKMLEVNTLMGKSSKELKAYSGQILNLTRRVPQSAKELSSALYDVVSAGVQGGQALKVVGLSARAAVAGVTDTKTAANAGLAVMNAYGKSTKDLGDIYDKLFKTVKGGVTTFPQLSAAIGTVLPVASAAGVEFNEVAASISALTKGGIATANATTYLRSGILALASPTKDAKEAMKDMGIVWQNGWVKTLRTLKPILDKFQTDAERIQALRAIIPDIRAGQAIIALTNNIDQLNESMLEMDNSKGAMQEAFRIMEESPVNKIKQMKNAFNELFITLGSKLNPAIMEFIKGWGYILNTDPNVRFVTLLDEEAMLRKQMNKLNEKANKLEEDKGKWYKSQHHTMKQLGKTYLKIQKIQERLVEIEKEKSELVPSVEDFRKQIKEGGTTTTTTTTASTTTPASPSGGGGGINKGTSVASALMAEMRTVQTQMQVAFEELGQAYDDGLISASQFFSAKRKMVSEYGQLEIQYLEDILDLTNDENKQRQIRAQIQSVQLQIQQQVIQVEREEADAIKEKNEALTQQQERNDELIKTIQQRVTQARLAAQDRYDAEIAAIKARHEEEIALLEEHEATKDEITEVHALHRQEIEQAYTQQRQENFDSWVSGVSQVVSTIEQIYAEQYQLEMQRERNRINTILDNMKQQGASEEAIAKKKSELRKEGYKEAKETWEKQKRAQIAMAVINAAQAILKGYAEYGPILGTVMAALTAVLTGIQIAKIKQQTFPGYAEGGLVRKGTGPKSDDVTARVSKGEYINTADSVSHYGPQVFEALNRKSVPRSVFSSVPSMSIRRPSLRFAEGGLVTKGTGGEVSTTQKIQIINYIDPSLFDQYVNTSDGEKSVVNVIKNRAYEVKEILMEETNMEGI